MDSLEACPLIVYSVGIGTKDKKQAAEKRKTAPCPSFVSVVGSYLGEEVAVHHCRKDEVSTSNS